MRRSFIEGCGGVCQCRRVGFPSTLNPHGPEQSARLAACDSPRPADGWRSARSAKPDRKLLAAMALRPWTALACASSKTGARSGSMREASFVGRAGDRSAPSSSMAGTPPSSSVRASNEYGSRGRILARASFSEAPSFAGASCCSASCSRSPRDLSRRVAGGSRSSWLASVMSLMTTTFPDSVDARCVDIARMSASRQPKALASCATSSKMPLEPARRSLTRQTRTPATPG